MSYPEVVGYAALTGRRGVDIMSGVPVAPGETLIVILTNGSSSPAGTTSPGWTSLGFDNAGSSNSCQILSKVASATTEELILSGGSTTSTVSNGQLIRITDASAISASVLASSTSSATYHNPPAHTSTSTIGEYLWFAVLTANHSGVSAPPPGYGNLSISRASTSAPAVSSAHKASTSRTEDPDLFTGTSTRSTLATIAVAGIVLDTIPPTITTAGSFTSEEGRSVRIALEADEAVTWSIIGGSDAAHFTLLGSTLTLGSKDYEQPLDTNADNTYEVVVRAIDNAGNATDQAITVQVTDVEFEITRRPIRYVWTS